MSEQNYESTKATVTLKKDFVNTKLDAKSGYGQAADLKMHFSKGADWHEYIVKNATATIGQASGDRTDGITVPVSFQQSCSMVYDHDGRSRCRSIW